MKRLLIQCYFLYDNTDQETRQETEGRCDIRLFNIKYDLLSSIWPPAIARRIGDMSNFCRVTGLRKQMVIWYKMMSRACSLTASRSGPAA